MSSLVAIDSEAGILPFFTSRSKLWASLFSAHLNMPTKKKLKNSDLEIRPVSAPLYKSRFSNLWIVSLAFSKSASTPVFVNH
jgi:hypothetical protein